MFVLTVMAPGPGVLSDAVVRRVADGVGARRVAWVAPGLAVDVFLERAVEVAGHLAGLKVDYALQRVAGRCKRLLVADMDSTMVAGETLDDLAALAGVGAACAAITARSMAGEVSFAESLRTRVAMLKGVDLAALARCWRGVEPMPGARTAIAAMRDEGMVCALVSGGFTYFTARVAALLGFDTHAANMLLDDGVVLTGTMAEPVLDGAGKRAVLESLARRNGVALAETMAVGDGANDREMVRAAGLGVSFHGKPALAAVADVCIRHCDLRALLWLQGLDEAAFRRAR